MKNFYVSPCIEVVELEIEDAILNLSGVENMNQGNGFGDLNLFPETRQ